jgi:hypothetical protein
MIDESIEKAGAQLHQRESPRKGGNQHRAVSSSQLVVVVSQTYSSFGRHQS